MPYEAVDVHDYLSMRNLQLGKINTKRSATEYALLPCGISETDFIPLYDEKCIAGLLFVELIRSDGWVSFIDCLAVLIRHDEDHMNAATVHHLQTVCLFV